VCDNCQPRSSLLRAFGQGGDDDPVETAKRRLRCYYQCVAQDILADSVRERPELGELGSMTDDEDDDDEWSLDDW
jgi:hypothetical protein